MDLTSVHRADAEAAGKYVREMLNPPRKRSTMTPDDRALVAWWCARWAGHWGNRALDYEAEAVRDSSEAAQA